MAEGRRGLGRGLSALLGEAESASTPEGRRAAGAQEIAIELIRRNPDQPRRVFGEDELDELAASIREQGCCSPSWSARSRSTQENTRSSPASAAGGPPSGPGCTLVPALVRDLDELRCWRSR